MNLLTRNFKTISNHWIAPFALALAVLGVPATGWAETKTAESKPAPCCAAKVAEKDTCAATADCTAVKDTAASLRDTWGIEVVALRLSAGGNMLDFRYKVLDSDKAAPISHVEWKPYLIDEKTGAKMVVPKMPKIGSLRQTAVKPPVGRVLATLFTNPNQLLKAGSKATVVIGDCRIENLTVQ